MNALATSINGITNVTNNNTDTRPRPHFNLNLPRNSCTIINTSIPNQISIETRDIIDNVTPIIIPDAQPTTTPSSSPPTIESQSETLRCPFPNCSYTTNTINGKQNVRSHYGRKHLKPRHTTNIPLYTRIAGTKKVCCAHCHTNGKNEPIQMPTLDYHLAICLPVSPFYRK